MGYLEVENVCRYLALSAGVCNVRHGVLRKYEIFQELV